MAIINKPCVICGNNNTIIWSEVKDLEYSTSEDVFTYFNCKSCSTIFIDEFLTDQLQEIYPGNYYSFLEQKPSIALKVKNYLDRRLFKKMLKRFKKTPINVLDVGGGSGWLLNNIKSIYSNVEFSQVIDIDINAKQQAEQSGHNFFHGTVEEFKSDIKFDLILMLNLIEHINDPLTTLNNLSKSLKPNGLILIKTPNIESWDAKIFKETYWGGLHAPRHWIIFSQKSFRQLIKKTPLEITKLNYTQGAPFWTWSVLAMLSRKRLIKISKEKPMIYHPLVPFLNILFATFDFLRLILGYKTSQMFIELENK